MKRTFFRRLIIVYVVLLILSLISIDFYAARALRDHHIGHVRDDLMPHLARAVPPAGPRGLDEWSRALEQTAGARISVIDQEGRVVGDSGEDPASMVNQLNEPEIQQALAEGMGWSRRRTVAGTENVFVTRAVVRDGRPAGFIRASLPLSDVNRTIRSLRIRLDLVVAAFFLLTGAVFLWQTGRMRTYIRQISDYSGALARGLFKNKLYLDDEGDLGEVAVNLNEMAEELQQNIQGREEEANRLNVILKSIPDAFLFINTRGMIELGNKAAREVFGDLSLEKKPFIEVVRSPEFISLIERVRDSHESGSAEFTIDYPAQRHLAVRVSPLFYEPAVLAGYVAIFNDMTHLKKLEQMRKDFVANVSHEIKTPVTAIRGFAETLLEGALDDREHAARFLTSIRSQSERLNRLVEDLLALFRIELGAVRIEKQEIELVPLIDSVIETVAARAARKGISVKRSSATEGGKVRADRDRLIQILLNLADNAIKFTEKGEIEIGLSREGDRPYLSVRDTGIGVPEHLVSRLGERFFRVDPSRSRELGGTGLGLAIVKHLVNAHEWEMKIESKEGAGTTVKMFFS